jgi:hypothetical protein
MHSNGFFVQRRLRRRRLSEEAMGLPDMQVTEFNWLTNLACKTQLAVEDPNTKTRRSTTTRPG